MADPRTPFDADYGTWQGRIAPEQYSTLDGDFVLQLGHERSGIVRSFVANDSHIVASTQDFSGTRKLTFRAHLRAPALPPGWNWQFLAAVNGQPQLFRDIDRNIETIDTALAMDAPIALLGSANIEIAFALLLDGPAGDPEPLEMPGLWIDALAAQTTGPSVEVFNRSPEPSETQTPVGTAILFTIARMTGSAAIDPAQLVVTVGGVVALSGGAFQPGFSGSLVDTTGSGPIWMVTVIPDVAFAPLTSVQINVTAAVYGVASTWIFTTEDTIAPRLLGALALTETTVRVTFDEAVIASSASASNDALNPANYVITLLDGTPAVTPSAVSAELESERVVVLTLDKIMTRGALYRIDVSGVEDLFGNVIAAPYNTATFTGYRWPVPAGRAINLFELLPQAMQAQDLTGDHRKFLGVLQEVFDVFWGLADKAPTVWDVDFAPLAWVDVMLADLGDPFGFLNLSEIEKRVLARTLVALYRTKGTGPGIVRALRFFLGIDAEIRVYAWAPYPIGQAIIGQTFVLGSSTQADLYTFEVVLPINLTASQRQSVVAIIDYMKVAHEHFRIIEPPIPVFIDHWQLGFSALGSQTLLHA